MWAGLKPGLRFFMRIFLTGGTGYIGSAVAAALRARNHEVLALVRAEADTSKLRNLGATLVAGDLESLPTLAAAGALNDADAFVSMAQPSANAAEPSRIALETFVGRGAFTLYTSGVWVLGNGTSDESSPARPLPLVAWRVPLEEMVLNARGAVLRPGCVYGGKQSLFARWFAAADAGEAIEIAGDGNNHWALVDVHDLADFYVRIIESRSTGTFHGIDDSYLTLNEVTQAIAPNGSIAHVAPPPGPFADALLVDQHVSSAATRERLGWLPKRDFAGSINEQWAEWRAENRSAVR